MVRVLAHRGVEEGPDPRGRLAGFSAVVTLPPMHMVLHIGCLALAVFALSRFFPGAVRVNSAGTAVAVAIVFSLLNFFLGWVIRALLFVPSLLTLGLLFLFVPFIVNAVLLWITDKIMDSFELRGARGLLVSAGVITLVNGVFAVMSHPAMHQGW
jgi:putative membrane protein